MIKNTNNTLCILGRKTCILLYLIHAPPVFSILDSFRLRRVGFHLPPANHAILLPVAVVLVEAVRVVDHGDVAHLGDEALTTRGVELLVIVPLPPCEDRVLGRMLGSFSPAASHSLLLSAPIAAIA